MRDNIIIILFMRFFWKIEKCSIAYRLQLKYYFCHFYIGVSSFSFSHKCGICAFFVFSVTIFEAIKEFHNFCLYISIYRTTLNLLFVGHQVRKNTCQYLSTIQVQLHSSIVILKHFQFVINPAYWTNRRLWLKIQIKHIFHICEKNWKKILKYKKWQK